MYDIQDARLQASSRITQAFCFKWSYTIWSRIVTMKWLHGKYVSPVFERHYFIRSAVLNLLTKGYWNIQYFLVWVCPSVNELLSQHVILLWYQMVRPFGLRSNNWHYYLRYVMNYMTYVWMFECEIIIYLWDERLHKWRTNIGNMETLLI